MDPGTRRNLLTMPDAELLALCRTERFRGTGRGGQKRNTTDSAVRLTHVQTGVSATSDATRSQQRNRTVALRRLRYELAVACRACPAELWTNGPAPGRRDRRYPLWLASVLDLLEQHGCSVRDVAQALGSSTGRLVRDMAKDPQLWQRVNERRRQEGLSVLRRP